MLIFGNHKTDQVIWNSLDAKASGTSDQMSGWEDYSSETDHLHFGDKLRAAQLDTELMYNRRKAIATQEGFYKSGSLSQRNSNPGNLKKSGYPRDEQGHSIFPNEVVGWLELSALLYKHNDKSLDQIGGFYATDPLWSSKVKKLMNI